MTDLDRALGALTTATNLLVACDYDGTLAPIVEDPAHAYPMPEAVAALRTLATLHNTNVGVISGRGLRDLAVLSRLPAEVHLIGSHGSEFDAGFAHALPSRLRARLERLLDAARALAAEYHGALVEEKPAGLAFHVRQVDPEQRDEALVRARRLLTRRGIQVRGGHMVVEASVVPTNKGQALERLRHLCGASAVLFIGDDLTDEDAFATLQGPDVGIKVGSGDTKATHRIDDPAAAARLLADLAERRRDWLHGASSTPIERHSLLSDHVTAAIVDDRGRVTWMCQPRLDSAGVFAELVGGPGAGYFSVRGPHSTRPLSQHYVAGSMVLETRWQGFTVTDWLDCSAGAALDPRAPRRLLRLAQGRGDLRIEFAPRLDFGRATTSMSPEEGGLRVHGTSTPIVLRAPTVRWEIVDEGRHQSARAAVRLDGTLAFELQLGDGGSTTDRIDERLRTTLDHWRCWATGLDLPSVSRDRVLRHALVLRSLCSLTWGGIAAAATTSLPEQLGGTRNWDYRFCWIRDGALAAASLVRLGETDTAERFLWWLGQVDRQRPLYTLDGHELAPEAAVAELSGYAGSRPVRIGNAADSQLQLDTLGPVAAVLDELDLRCPIDDNHLDLLKSLVELIGRSWTRPDHGIWEIRLTPRHWVHSKVMCWQTIDRAIRVLQRHELFVPPSWTALRDQIAHEVLVVGWSDELGAFGAAYDLAEPDAATLHIGLSGLLPPDDPRFLSTVDVVEERLRRGPVVDRYRYDDGLPGREGGWLVCSSWLVDAYALCGRKEDALDLFEQISALAGPTGLLSEQYEPDTGRALGNIPQAYSHSALIDNAVHLSGR